MILRKITAIVLATSLLDFQGLSLLSADLASKGRTISDAAFLQSLSSFVTLEEDYMPSRGELFQDERFVLLIRDLHADYEAQMNIAKMLETVAGYWLADQPVSQSSGTQVYWHTGKLLVLAEGATGKVDTSFFSSFPDPGIRKSLTQDFMKEGWVTGPEFLSIWKGDEFPMEIWGVEEPELYLDNFRNFQAIHAHVGATDEWFSEFEKVLDLLKGKVYGPELLELDRKFQGWRHGDVGLEDLMGYLDTKMQNPKSEMLEDQYPNIHQYSEVLKIKKEVDWVRVNEERERLIQDLSMSLGKEELSILIQKSLGLRLGRINTASYVNFLVNQLNALGRPLDAYPILSKTLAVYDLEDDVDIGELMNEIESCENRLRDRLLQSSNEKSLKKLDQSLQLFRKMSKLHLSRGDWESVKENESQIQPHVLVRLLEGQAREVGIRTSSQLEPFLKESTLSELLKRTEAFYKTASARDEILADQALEHMEKRGIKEAVLIVGGFHVEGIQKILRARGIGYQVVTPHVSHSTGDEVYLARMMDERFKFQSLALPSPFSALIQLLGPLVREGTWKNLALSFVRAWLRKHLKGREDRYRSVLLQEFEAWKRVVKEKLEVYSGQDKILQLLEEEIRNGRLPQEEVIDLVQVKELMKLGQTHAEITLEFLKRFYPEKTELIRESEVFYGTKPWLFSLGEAKSILLARLKTLNEKARDFLELLRSLDQSQLGTEEIPRIGKAMGQIGKVVEEIKGLAPRTAHIKAKGDPSFYELLRNVLHNGGVDFFVQSLAYRLRDLKTRVDERKAEISWALEEIPSRIWSQELFIKILETGSNLGDHDLNEILRELLPMYEREARVRGLDFEAQIPSERIVIKNCDPNLVKLALANLMENAMKYTKQGKISVKVSTGEVNLGGWTNRAAILELEDTGIGIPDSDVDHIFSSGFRASNVGDVKGTGLGLAIVQKIVKTMMHGEIWVDSEVGVGTKFTLHLPLASDAEERGSSRALKLAGVLAFIGVVGDLVRYVFLSTDSPLVTSGFTPSQGPLSILFAFMAVGIVFSTWTWRNPVFKKLKQQGWKIGKIMDAVENFKRYEISQGKRHRVLEVVLDGRKIVSAHTLRLKKDGRSVIVQTLYEDNLREPTYKPRRRWFFVTVFSLLGLGGLVVYVKRFLGLDKEALLSEIHKAMVDSPQKEKVAELLQRIDEGTYQLVLDHLPARSSDQSPFRLDPVEKKLTVYTQVLYGLKMTLRELALVHAAKLMDYAPYDLEANHVTQEIGELKASTVVRLTVEELQKDEVLRKLFQRRLALRLWPEAMAAREATMYYASMQQVREKSNEFIREVVARSPAAVRFRYLVQGSRYHGDIRHRRLIFSVLDSLLRNDENEEWLAALDLEIRMGNTFPITSRDFNVRAVVERLRESETFFLQRMGELEGNQNREGRIREIEKMKLNENHPLFKYLFQDPMSRNPRGYSGLPNEIYSEFVLNGLSAGRSIGVTFSEGKVSFVDVIDERTKKPFPRMALSASESNGIISTLSSVIPGSDPESRFFSWVPDSARGPAHRQVRDDRKGGLTIIFIDALDEAIKKELKTRGKKIPQDCSGSHYGLSRPQIYLDRSLLNNPPELLRQLYHEVLERRKVIAELERYDKDWRSHRGFPAVKMMISHIAKREHQALISEEKSSLTSGDPDNARDLTSYEYRFGIKALVDQFEKEEFRPESFQKIFGPYLRGLKENPTTDLELTVLAFLAQIAAKVLPEKRGMKQVPSPAQLEAAFLLSRRNRVDGEKSSGGGFVGELVAGEGKTLAIALAGALEVLKGHKVHVMTMNEYLAHWSLDEMQPLFQALGIKAGVLERRRDRKKVYENDITYGASDHFVYDRIHDELSKDDDRAQREHEVLLVDEVDSIAIDEAINPLVVAAQVRGKAKLPEDIYAKAMEFVQSVVPGMDVDLDFALRKVTMRESGDKLVKAFIKWILATYSEKAWPHLRKDLPSLVIQALTAEHFYRRNVDYVVLDDDVVIVDEFTGRLQPDRRYDFFLHELIAAKEKKPIPSAVFEVGRMTYPEYFQLYKHVSGVTGTIHEAQKEFRTRYGLVSKKIEPARPIARVDYPDILFRTKEEKWKAVIRKTKQMTYEERRPMIIGVKNIEEAMTLQKKLEAEGIAHEVLSGLEDEREAQLIKKAGELDDDGRGRITIITNIAARGTDFQIQSEALARGGLFILGTERFRAGRCDWQLRGRGGRQGEKASSQFFVSLEDDLVRHHANGYERDILSHLLAAGQGEDPRVTEILDGIQNRVEDLDRDMRNQVMFFVKSFESQSRFIQNLGEALESVDFTSRTSLQQKLQEVWDGWGLKGGEIYFPSIENTRPGELARDYWLHRNIIVWKDPKGHEKEYLLKLFVARRESYELRLRKLEDSLRFENLSYAEQRSKYLDELRRGLEYFLTGLLRDYDYLTEKSLSQVRHGILRDWLVELIKKSGGDKTRLKALFKEEVPGISLGWFHKFFGRNGLIAFMNKVKRDAGDGFIQQGDKSWAVFEARRTEIEKNDITWDYRARLIGLLEGSLQNPALSSDVKNKLVAELDKLKGQNLRVYGFQSIVEGKDDFMLGYRDSGKNAFYYASDVVKNLSERGPPTLVEEYLLHEILCPLFGHNEAILLQQKLFPQHYPNLGRWAEQDLKKPYKGLLGIALRDRIDRHQSVVIQGRLPAGGRLEFNKRPWGKFGNYAGSDYELEIQGGFPRKILFKKDQTSVEFLPIIDNRTGQIIDVHTGKIRREKFVEYEDVTILTYTGASEGKLELGGGRPSMGDQGEKDRRAWAKFYKNPGEKVKVVVRHGIVHRCTSLESDLDAKFVGVWNRQTQKYETSFFGGVTQDELNLLTEDHELHGVELSKNGTLELGGESWMTFGPAFGHKRANVVEIRRTSNGRAVIVRAKVVAGDIIVADKSLSLVHSIPPEVVEDSFELGEFMGVFEKFSERKIVDEKRGLLESYFITKRIGDDGVLEAHGYWGRFSMYPGALVRAKIISGERTYVQFLEDKDGNPILDKDGKPLVIDVRKNIITERLTKTRTKEIHKGKAARPKSPQGRRGVNRERTLVQPFNLNRYYLEEARLSLAEQAGLVRSISSGQSGAARTLAETYIWLVKRSAKKFADPGFDFYEELVQSGVIRLYELVGEFTSRFQNVGNSVSDFEPWVERELNQYFDQLRKDRNSQMFSEFSFDHFSPAGQGFDFGDEARSMGDFIEDPTARFEDEVIERLDSEAATARVGLEATPEPRGYSGLPNEVYTEPIRKALEEGRFMAVRFRDGRVRKLSLRGGGADEVISVIDGIATGRRDIGPSSKGGLSRNDEERVLEDLEEKLQHFPYSKKAIQDALDSVDLIFVEGLDEAVEEELDKQAHDLPKNCSGSHYGLSREQIYLDINLLEGSPERLWKELYHELAERDYVIKKLNRYFKNWKEDRENPKIQGFIRRTAAKKHRALLEEEGRTVSGRDRVPHWLDPLVLSVAKRVDGKRFKRPEGIGPIDRSSMTPEEYGKRLHMALLAVQGNKSRAARWLGIDSNVFRAHLGTNSPLTHRSTHLAIAALWVDPMLERRKALEILIAVGGSFEAATRRLRISRETLMEYLEELGILVSQDRERLEPHELLWCYVLIQMANGVKKRGRPLMKITPFSGHREPAEDRRGDLIDEIASSPPEVASRNDMSFDDQQELVAAALIEAHFNIKKAAALLGVGPRFFVRLLRQGITSVENARAQPARYSSAEVSRFLASILQDVSRRVPILLEDLRAVAEAWDKKGPDAFLKEVTGFFSGFTLIINGAEVIEYYRTVLGFNEDEDRERLDTFLAEIAEKFHVDRIVMFLNQGDMDRLNYSYGFMSDDLALLYTFRDNLAFLLDPKKWQVTDVYKEKIGKWLKDLLGMHSVLFVGPSERYVEHLPERALTLFATRSKEYVEHYGPLTSADEDAIRHDLNELIEEGRAPWVPMAQKLREEGYYSFDRLIEVLRRVLVKAEHDLEEDALDGFLYALENVRGFLLRLEEKLKKGELDGYEIESLKAVLSGYIKGLEARIPDDAKKRAVFGKILEMEPHFQATTPIREVLGETAPELKIEGDLWVDHYDEKLFKYVMGTLEVGDTRADSNMTIRLTHEERDLSGKGKVPCAVIEIENEGAGLSEDELAKLFPKNYLADYSDDKGMSFSVARAIIELVMGGKLEWESIKIPVIPGTDPESRLDPRVKPEDDDRSESREGQGVKFSITLPLVEPPTGGHREEAKGRRGDLIDGIAAHPTGARNDTDTLLDQIMSIGREKNEINLEEQIEALRDFYKDKIIPLENRAEFFKALVQAVLDHKQMFTLGQSNLIETLHFFFGGDFINRDGHNLTFEQYKGLWELYDLILPDKKMATSLMWVLSQITLFYPQIQIAGASKKTALEFASKKFDDYLRRFDQIVATPGFDETRNFAFDFLDSFGKEFIDHTFKVLEEAGEGSALYDAILNHLIFPLCSNSSIAYYVRPLAQKQIKPATRLNIVTRVETPRQAWDAIFGDEVNARKFLKAATLIRKIYPFEMTKDDARPPLKYAQEEELVFQLGPNLFMTPVTESFRRHLVYATGENGKIKFAFEVIIPGELGHKRDIWFEDRYRIAMEVREAFPDGDYCPVPLFTKRFPFGDYDFYGQEFKFDENTPLKVMAFEYKLDEDGKRLQFVPPERIKFLSEQWQISLRELEDNIARQVARLTAMTHVLGYVGNNANGQDHHLQNFRFIEDWKNRRVKIQLAGDFVAFEQPENLYDAIQRLQRDRQAIIDYEGRNIPGLVEILTTLDKTALDALFDEVKTEVEGDFARRGGLKTVHLHEGRFLLNSQTGELRPGPEFGFQAQNNYSFIRHGETDWNKEHRLQGRNNIDLNEQGQKEAREGAEKLYEQHEADIKQGKLPIIYSSPLSRAHEMAQVFAALVKERTGQILIIYFDDDLQEMSWGDWTGKTKKECRALDANLYERWVRGVDYNVKHPGEGTESPLEALQRMRTVYDKLEGRHQGENILIFGHGQTLSFLDLYLGDQSHIDEQGRLNFIKGRLENGGIKIHSLVKVLPLGQHEDGTKVPRAPPPEEKRELSKQEQASIRGQIFNHQDGIVLAPTIKALKDLGILDLLIKNPKITMKQILDHLGMDHEHSGYLHVAMQVLADQGWLKREGEPATQDMQFGLTDEGRAAMSLADAYDEVVNFIPQATKMDDYLFGETRGPPGDFAKLVERAKSGWNLQVVIPASEPESRKSSQDDIARQITRHLDGLLMGPVMVSLGRRGLFGPLTERDKTLTPMDAHFENGLLDADKLKRSNIGDFERVSQSLDLLIHQGWCTKDEKGWRLTPEGIFAASIASAYGVTTSYLNTSEKLPQLLKGGDFDSLFSRTVEGNETHVNRTMNVWGTGGAHKKYFEMIDKIIIEIFNRPLEKQPKGIADMGCGNGAFLRHLYKVVKEQTLRGQHMDTHPLQIVGADFFGEARLAATKILEEAGIPNTHVVFGDINDPDALADELDKLGIGSEDMLHVRSFLDHNRPHMRPEFSYTHRQSNDRNAYVDVNARPINPKELEQSFVEHFKRWAPYLEKFGLVVIELHGLPEELISKNLGGTLGLTYAATHGYSRQYILPIPEFVKVAEEAGLELMNQVKIPSKDTATISINYFRAKIKSKINESEMAEEILRHLEQKQNPSGMVAIVSLVRDTLIKLYPRLEKDGNSDLRRRVISEVFQKAKERRLWLKGRGSVDRGAGENIIFPPELIMLIRDDGLPSEIIEVLEKIPGTSLFFKYLDYLRIKHQTRPDVQVLLLETYLRYYLMVNVIDAEKAELQKYFDLDFQSRFAEKYKTSFNIDELLVAYIVARFTKSDLELFNKEYDNLKVSDHLDSLFMGNDIGNLFIEDGSDEMRLDLLRRLANRMQREARPGTGEIEADLRTLGSVVLSLTSLRMFEVVHRSKDSRRLTEEAA